jgi:hypothetical protein
MFHTTRRKEQTMMAKLHAEAQLHAEARRIAIEEAKNDPNKHGYTLDAREGLPWEPHAWVVNAIAKALARDQRSFAMTVPAVDTQPFIIELTYRVKAASRSEAWALLAKYQSDSQFMIEQDLRKHRGSQVVDLIDCEVKSPEDSETVAAQAFLAAAIEWRQRVNLVPNNPFTQELLDKLDALVILRDRK